jgi:hypothetical protein
MTDAKWKAFFDAMVAVKLYDAKMPYQQAYDLRFVRGMPMNFR